MSLFTQILSLALSKRKHSFEAMKNDPIGHQRAAFNHLIELGKVTQFGRDHRLDRVKSYEDYRRSVPIRNYEDFSSYFSAIRSGQENVLCTGKPRYWGKTGGTSGKDKLVPIYPAAIKQSRKTFETALTLHLAENPHARILGKKILFLGSCSPLTQENGIPSGFMSSIMVNEFSPLIKKFILPGSRVNHLIAWQEKIAAIFEMTRNEDLCIVAAMPPWMSAFFHYVVEKTGKPILETWPNLSLLIHSGVSMDSYRDDILQLLGGSGAHVLPSFKNGYGATEGNFAVQEKGTDEDLLLVADSVFYEFIPLEAFQSGKSEESRISLEDVRVGEEYVFVLTTPGGLWSYVIGDTIRFSSVHPYRFKISGRTTQFLNLAGEKLSADQATSAVTVAAQKTEARIKEFTLFPCNAEINTGRFLPGHQWFVEFSKPPLSGSEFLNHLDENLLELNPLYRVRRNSSFGETPLLAPPILTPLARGAYQRWQEVKGRQGGHFKIPRISSNLQFKSELLKGVNHE
jgi:hypothetical protein